MHDKQMYYCYRGNGPSYPLRKRLVSVTMATLGEGGGIPSGHNGNAGGGRGAYLYSRVCVHGTFRLRGLLERPCMVQSSSQAFTFIQ